MFKELQSSNPVLRQAASRYIRCRTGREGRLMCLPVFPGIMFALLGKMRKGGDCNKHASKEGCREGC